ncbi:DUF5683 domain-containing protein [Maribacter algarum]|uniref:DUF5683 domain-containing protein n=1 Tax=Maribacter algarum (ex Zhang et al. 2020) TaxID=2578118 RepID=UPI001486FBE6|nr:DUF5683 domain-containing protein [Maribacter algarum]
MVSRQFIISFVFVLSAFISWGQEEDIDNPAVDSLKTDLKGEGFVIDTLVSKRRSLNPLAPAKAGFYSAVLPGLGQIYNKRYWKVPIVWAAIGGGAYAYVNFDNRYNAFRTAFKRRKAGFTDDEFYDLRLEPGEVTTRTTPEIDDQRLERLQNDRQNDRDLALLATIVLYALNVVDANVDAHLKQFNIDDDLSMDMEFQPYLEVNPITTDPHYGMALIVKF